MAAKELKRPGTLLSLPCACALAEQRDEAGVVVVVAEIGPALFGVPRVGSAHRLKQRERVRDWIAVRAARREESGGGRC